MNDVAIRIAGPEDVGALARLRAAWTADDEPGFEERLAEWLAADGVRRTVWLATETGGAPAGMASLFEYRRMPRPGRPPSAWGYVSNMYVMERLRRRGIGTALLAAIIAAADARGYARLVLSPSDEAIPFYLDNGFVVPDEHAGEHRLLVRPRP